MISNGVPKAPKSQVPKALGPRTQNLSNTRRIKPFLDGAGLGLGWVADPADSEKPAPGLGT